MKKQMKCLICKNGEVIEGGNTTLTLERNSATIVFKDVPARICDNCGETYVDELTATRLLKIADEIIKSGVEVDIRHYIAA